MSLSVPSDFSRVDAQNDVVLVRSEGDVRPWSTGGTVFFVDVVQRHGVDRRRPPRIRVNRLDHQLHLRAAGVGGGARDNFQQPEVKSTVDLCGGKVQRGTQKRFFLPKKSFAGKTRWNAVQLSSI